MTLSNITFSPKKIIREIKRNPQGITQQAVLEKTVSGYKGSDNSASFTSRFRDMESAGYIYAVRNTKNNQPSGEIRPSSSIDDGLPDFE